MIRITDKEFEAIVAAAIDNIPEKYAKNLHNVAFVTEDIPSPEQRRKLELHDNQTLFGLYEGVPLTKRGAGYNLVLPDKITLFKVPIEMSSNSQAELIDQVNKTVWHEVAHYFGLDHEQIHRLEQQ